MEKIDCLDLCKNCGCTRYECSYCYKRDLYRHVDDKIKMKENMKAIRDSNVFVMSMGVLFKTIK